MAYLRPILFMVSIIMHIGCLSDPFPEYDVSLEVKQLSPPAKSTVKRGDVITAKINYDMSGGDEWEWNIQVVKKSGEVETLESGIIQNLHGTLAMSIPVNNEFAHRCTEFKYPYTFIFEMRTYELLSGESQGRKKLHYYYDFTSNHGLGAGDSVSAIVTTDADRIIIGGAFSTYNGEEAAAMIRLNADGERDMDFKASTQSSNYAVRRLLSQPDKKMVVGESHSSGYDKIRRVLPDGTSDGAFISYRNYHEKLVCIAQQVDGKVLAGFDSGYKNDGPVTGGIIRLNADGSRDFTYNSGGNGFERSYDRWYTIEAIGFQSDGRILVGGGFTSYNMEAVPFGFVRLNTDGVLDTGFSAGNIAVHRILVLPDDSMLIGGARNYYDVFLKLNPDGTPDVNFNSGISSIDGQVKSIILLPDDKILIGGTFSRYNGTPVPKGIIRLHSNGSHDDTFNPDGAGCLKDESIYCLAVQPDGKILIGGAFTHYNGIDVPDNIMRLNADGTPDLTFNPKP